jgi:polysaccharide biosynthesis/export protein
MTSRTHLVYIISAITLLPGVLIGCSTERVISRNQIKTNLAPARFQGMPEYKIQPGDQLDVKFYYTPELNETVIVRPDGKISLQLIGDVTVAGLTPTLVNSTLAQKYAPELRRPVVTVIVKTSTAQQVYVGGEIEKEGPIDFTSGMTALQAVIKAGGFKETAKPEEVLVIRVDKDNKVVPYPVNLQSVYSEPYEVDLQLQPYDVVYVPKTFIAEANKFVKQYFQISCCLRDGPSRSVDLSLRQSDTSSKTSTRTLLWGINEWKHIR